MESTAALSANRHRIIIGVDDAPEVIGLLKLVLTDAGYSFFGCQSGAECLQLVSRVQPRLILLDVEMPRQDGYETCRSLRKISELDTVPIAFLTLRKSSEDVRTGVMAGGNDFMTKPFQRDRLMERCAHWTTRRIEPRPRATATSRAESHPGSPALSRGR